MALKFNEIKTTQAAAYFLIKNKGSERYLKIIKLLYLADRSAINQIGLPITGDRYVSMPRGPVTSQTLDLINYSPDPSKASYWHDYISAPRNYCIMLNNNPGVGQLSQAEMDVLDEVYDKFGTMNVWALVEYTHHLPEYKDPEGSSIPIQIEDILDGLGKTESEKKLIMEQMDFAAGIEAFFS